MLSGDQHKCARLSATNLLSHGCANFGRGKVLPEFIQNSNNSKLNGQQRSREKLARNFDEVATWTPRDND